MVIKDEFRLVLRTRREEEAMSEQDVASLVRLSAAEYSDIEHDKTEWRMVVPFFKLKFLIKLFNIDIAEMFESRPAHNSLSKYHEISDIIKERRSALGLSAEEFADRAGFFPVFASIVEEHPLGLELYPLQVAVLVAEVLQIPPEEFIVWIVNH